MRTPRRRLLLLAAWLTLALAPLSACAGGAGDEEQFENEGQEERDNGERDEDNEEDED